MYIKSLTLQNFRNYEAQTLQFHSGTNVFCGDNAQGKTNLLEALYVFSMGKSFRTVCDADLIRFGADYTKASLSFCDRHREHTLEIIILRNKKKQIKINGVTISRLSELVGHLNVVLFYPEELGLVKEGPYVRRHFMDVAMSQLRPTYYHALGRYQRVLEQRNKLIKRTRLSGGDSFRETVFAWNEKLVDYGLELMNYRSVFMERLGELAAKAHYEASGEKLQLIYKPRFTTKEAFLEKLEENFERELEQGCTLYGPHREDFDIFINDKEAKSFGSQGQQRSAVLALKLAQADLLFEEYGEYPVLLLDDIMSELDQNRRAYLAGKIPDKQVFITCTDAEGLLDGGQMYSVSAGSVTLG
ncbi:MAG: DNA replication/repair protein RecF [Ruminococcaceae bacterium]|nr:DNA replication/repair protein RecF [Oscillospiraceae bacterium]